MGCGAMPRPVRLAGQRLRRRPDKCDAGCRRHKLHITHFRRCRRRKLAHSAAPPSSRRNPAKRFRREPCWGEVIKLPFCIFSAFLCGGGITTLGPLWLCRNNPARGLFQQKKRLSQSGCSAPTDTLFPPAHSAFSAFLHGGGITTLGVRFMLLKRWTPAGHGGVFAVFMPPQNSPCAG